MKRKMTWAVLFVILALSFSFVTIAYSGVSIPTFDAFQDGQNSQQLSLSVPLLMGGLHGNSTTLNQPTRMEIYTYVKNNPGIHFRGVCQGLDLSVGVAQYHLDILVHAGLLKTYSDGPNKRYFESSFDQSNAPLTSLLRHETTRKILTLLSQQSSMLHKDLAQNLDISSQALTWQMNKLKEAGLVTSAKEGLSVRYVLNPEKASYIIFLVGLTGNSVSHIF